MLLLYNIVLKVIIKNYAFRKSKICLTYTLQKKHQRPLTNEEGRVSRKLTITDLESFIILALWPWRRCWAVGTKGSLTEWVKEVLVEQPLALPGSAKNVKINMFTCDRWQVTCDMWPMTHDTGHMTHDK